MTDIVEMLVDAAGGNEAHVCAIAAAEIKRNLSEIEKLRAEATQLRQAVGVLTTLHPTMEIDVNNPVQMALEIVSYVTESRDAEIERLRAADVLMVAEFECQEREITKLVRLLRDGLVGADPRWMTTDAGREWLLRVREALGE